MSTTALIIAILVAFLGTALTLFLAKVLTKKKWRTALFVAYLGSSPIGPVGTLITILIVSENLNSPIMAGVAFLVALIHTAIIMGVTTKTIKTLEKEGERKP